ncbi:Neutrophil cytosol factor 2 [Sphaceloma murrayae]|uniref:Neutrophil cytosol factor 2 n=1 Tax=Sphaceloma murrayae TaxID=2082308 RepID=A0A2K1QFW5_9PEZI|nr:Neutrophil cytosol factor 2 [Sphaceloma murrayae]
MSLRQEIETWVSALKHYDLQEYDGALYAFRQIADTSKILFNCGIIHATLGEHGKAVECYQRSTQLDQYLAIAYFQQGVSNFLMGDFEEALANFNDTLLYLRGNRNIDYSQLGLKFKLHSCEALFNRGLCYFYLQQREAAMSDLLFAAQEKAVPDHNVIDDAIRERIEGYTVFSIPVGLVYRPNEAKVKNLRTKDYLGRARLIAQEQNHRQERRQLSAQDLSSSLAFDGDGSYAAMHLVKPGLSSRNRQQSEPPLHRAVFPPTPPPELDRSPILDEARRCTPRSSTESQATSSHRRGSSETATSPSRSITSLHRRTTKPNKLDLGIAAFESSPTDVPSGPTPAPHRGPFRSASERPSARRPAPSHIDTSFSSRAANQAVSAAATRSRDRLSVLDNPRSPTVSSPESIPPLRTHRRSHSGSTITASHGSWTDIVRGRRVGSIDEADEDPSPVSRPSDTDRSSGVSDASGRSGVGDEGETPASEDGTGIVGFEIIGGREGWHAGAVKTPPLPVRNPSRRESSLVREGSRVRAGRERSTARHGREKSAVRSGREGSSVRDGRRDGSRFREVTDGPPSVKRVRVKLHGETDTRFLMIGPATGLVEMTDLIKTKLSINGECKVKMRDEEGDFVTVGDAEDWDMCLDGVKRAARSDWEASEWDASGDVGELGKLDLWVTAVV